MTSSILNRPAAVAPFMMSALALALVVGQLAIAATARQPDEGTAAHLWQILIAAQLPIFALYAVTSSPGRWRRTATVLALQIGAAVAAAAPVFLLGW